MARVLIVDDERSIRRTLGEFLRVDGHEVSEAEDAEVALLCLQRSEFDVVVSDVILPRVNGVELLRQIQATAPHVQVVMMTGEPTVETASESLRAGAADYLFKPINKAGILRAVTNAARLKALEDTRRRLEGENQAHRENLERLVDERTRQLHLSEERARELSRFNQGVLDALTAHICVLAADGTILAVNQVWRAFGTANPPAPVEADVGANYFSVCDRVQGDERTMAREVLAGLQAVSRGELREFSHEYPCHSPEVRRWFLLRATRFSAAEPVRVVVAHVDITERVGAEERLHEQAALLDAANDAIYVHDLDDTVRYWNHGAERLYGWSSAEAVGRKLPEVVNLDRAEARAANAVLRAQGSWSGELKETNRMGKPLVVFSRWTLLPEKAGRPAKILAINADLTEKKQLEAQFLRAQRLEGLGALASGISHDLNNILSPILITVPLLRDALPKSDDQPLLDIIEESVLRGANIVKQLLTFARGEPDARIPLQVRHLLREQQKVIRETFPRDIDSRVDLTGDLWALLGDPTQIHQAIMNLCVNARDAMPDGGRLLIEAKNVSVDEQFAALVPGAKAGPFVCLSVSDTGTGIAPDIMDRIFDPFFTTKEIGKGTGLGLATVLGITRGHGGFVQVDSQLGIGTTFNLYFPALPETPVPVAAGGVQPAFLGHGELVLVVDDESLVRESVRRTLEFHHYRVVTAAHGAEALAIFSQRREEVRVVITDMMMPIMNGPATIIALRTLEMRLLIIGMSGLTERNNVKGIDLADLAGFLDKPFAADTLLAALRKALDAAVASA